MNDRALASIAIVTAIAVAKPLVPVAQETGKAVEILASARKAIGERALESMKTFSVQSSLQRNVGTMQINSDVEILLELPDKYARTESLNGGGGMMVAGGGTTGFNGDRPVQSADTGAFGGGGGMIVRIGPGPGPAGPAGTAAAPTPEQLEQRAHAMVRGSQAEASRLMLGWFAMAHPVVTATYTYLGDAESPDGKAYVIEVKNADGFAARLFVDEDTHLPLMVTYRAALPRVVTNAVRMSPDEAAKQIKDLQDQPPETGDYTIYFEDWRDADGVKFPFKLRRAVAGSTNEEWTVSRIKLNPKIDPKKFTGEAK